MMKEFVEQCGIYRIFRVGPEYLRNVAEFVVKVNYRHHTGNTYPANLDEEINLVYEEELRYTATSHIFIAESNAGEMIGCIRVAKWDMMNDLPMQKIFNVNPLERIGCIRPDSSVWHVGRFAVGSNAGVSRVSLFKKLMVYAITPICQETDSYMLAECDCKLLRVMGLLGIDTIKLGEGIHYLGSETIPVYAHRQGLLNFLYEYGSKSNSAKNYQGSVNVA
ncbi:hypothetical protein [Bacteroides cellulosilyticus]|jgi:hypothetical protein|uniref:hypothetical protein n=1 Tax=Bacteroides cellulosilyticus TaxID=246787 RepID=UPI0022E85D96|nr:hypothetical protein [Bacteroides cellulosilyticus]